MDSIRSIFVIATNTQAILSIINVGGVVILPAKMKNVIFIRSAERNSTREMLETVNIFVVVADNLRVERRKRQIYT